MNQDIKIVVVGDGGVGKTSLLFTYCKAHFPDVYEPTIFDTFQKVLSVDHYQKVTLTLVDTAGQEDYDRLRPLSYPKTDVFLLCFALDNEESYQNIAAKWAPEVKHYSSKSKLVLVGLKHDLRSKLISKKKGEKLARKISARFYMQCSSKTHDGLYELFDQVVKAVLFKTHDLKAKCTVL